MEKRALILFLKYPEKGKVKTRLAKTLGDDFVLELYQHFIIDILETCKKIDSNIILAISFENGCIQNTLFYEEYTCISQRGYNLGDKMYNAFFDIFSQGYSKLVLIGSDIPDLPAEIITDAFNKLDQDDIVLGPCKDGGYYLIGLNNEKNDHSIFDGVPWSTPLVMERTIDNLKSKGLSWNFLIPLNDIDNSNDLKCYYENNRNRDVRSSTMKFILQNTSIFL